MEDNQAVEVGEDKHPVPEGWTKPPSLTDLKTDFDGAKADHDTQVAKIQVWLDNLNVEGAAKPKKVKGRSEAQPKLIRKQAEWRYSSLSEPFLSAEDMFDVKPLTWEDAKSAKQNGLLLNNQMNTKLDKVAFIDGYVRAAVDKGTVIVRTGWVNKEETVTEVQPIYGFRPNPQLGPLHEELAQMKATNPTGYRFEVPEPLQAAHDQTMEVGIPLEPFINGAEEVEVVKTLKNQPELVICDHRNITIDPSCEGNVDKAKFIIHSFETSLSTLREEGDRYFGLDELNLSVAPTPLSSPDYESDSEEDTFTFKDDPRKKFVAHEYWGFWDYDGSGIAKPFVMTWVGDTVIRLEENPFPDKQLPFTFVSFMPVEASVYGEPDGELLTDNQKVAGAVTRGMIDILGKSANAQTGVRKDALDATNRRKYETGQDYQYNPHIDPRSAFHMHTFSEIPQSAPYMLNLQYQEAESYTGVKTYNEGVNGNQLGEVVAGIRGAMDAASKRETGILRRLAKGMEKIGRKIIAMNAEFLDEEEVVRITNTEFSPIRRDDLAGNHDLRVTVTTAEEDAAKIEKLSFTLQTMGPKMDFGASKMIMGKIARLQKMPDLAHKIENFEPQPDPMQQQMAQMEMQLKQLEMAEMESKIKGNYASAGLDMAKAEEAIAKARVLGSQADKSDLDFVEQESGVTQEREIEKVGVQGNLNLQLEDKKQAGAELRKYKNVV